MTATTSDGVQRYEAPIDDVPVAILIVDASGCAVGANSAWSELANRSVIDSEGAGWLDALEPCDRGRAKQAVVDAGEIGALTIDEWRIRRGPGREVPSGLATVTARIRPTTANLRVVALVDTSYWRVRLADLEELARHDPLTGLLNRTVLANHVRQALLRAERTGLPPTFLFIDVDGFKLVNDSYGHPAGDRVLQALARQLRGASRESDTLARVGGDEFALLCEDVTDADLEKVIERLKQAAREPIETQGRSLNLSISIGVAVANPAVDTFESLVERADRELYASRKNTPHPNRSVPTRTSPESSRLASPSPSPSRHLSPPPSPYRAG